ncbi:hypothetical protein NLU13_1885 [Sarocladium strictum]|uniref:Uncharacterized protein n=1 Tax=Sarocladium strictum TaxID=5046 RepID=A0AA39LCS6_SARSR|nr:hypothetical protein NLU13_1885 [Sarocladium strictum]
MFEQPQAKRVRRDELFDSGGSDDGDGSDELMEREMRALLNEQIAKSLGLLQADEPSDRIASKGQGSLNETKAASQSKSEPGNGEEEDAADEFDFQLFSGSAPTTKVVLEDDHPGDGALVRRRPQSYYLITTISEEQKRRYAAAAVTADEILQRAKQRSWGLELPWKVIHASSNGKLNSAYETGQAASAREGKGRPGKKKRIAMRTKARAAMEQAKLASAKMAEKEEHIKDKKKRLNRAKKLRRRAKAREQKAGGGGGGEDSGDSDDSA